jgi:hypothetical protein
MIKPHKVTVGKVKEAGSTPGRKVASTHPPMEKKHSDTSKQTGTATKSKTSTAAAKKNTSAKGMKKVRKADY